MATITITRTETKQGNKGPYTLAHLEGGKRAYVWDRELAQALGPGVWEAELEERGGFLRLRSARPIASANGAQREAQEREPLSATAQERLEALRLAVAMVGQVRPQDVPQVIEAAQAILEWLKQGEG